MGEVFVVDSQATMNLVPPKQRIKGTYVLYTLLGLALFGVFVEAVLIYKLYQRISKQMPSELIQVSKQTGENETQDHACSTETPAPLPIPKTDTDNRPAAFLHHNHSQKSAMMHWDHRGFPAMMHSFNYSKGNLIIPRDGLYFLFSKVSFRINCSFFTHEVKLNSSRYSDHPIILMTDTRLSCVNQIKNHEKNQFSSYLGGVWKLYKKDKVFVSVSNHSSLVGERTENFFGGFMI